MNKIAKRLVAGVSAAALLVSAVGVDQLADLFTKTSYAASGSGKFAQSTGFNNLEQDTTTGNDKYNTGYGLHTNKTAKEVGSDGRTFDVDLESWYVGENPVDVATILDASGSMAWTVDTLKPLELNATSMGINVDELKTTYSINNADLEKFSDYKDELTKVLAAIQDKNKGYLPQEVVDMILKNDDDHTDNTKLSYAGYKYYVYENRSSVSEFVPLGYWDGGKTAEKFSPIGYYPFENSLENKVNGDFATVINNTTDGTPFDEAAIIETAAPDFRDDSNANKHGKVLYLNDSVNNGAVFLNVSKDSLLGTDNNFSLLFQANGDTKGTGNTDIIYIGNLNDTANGIRIFYDEAGNLKIQYNATVVDTGSDFKNGWQTFKFVFEDSTVKFTVGASNLNEIISDFTLDLSAINAADFGIIVGGLIDGGKYEGINDLEIDNVYLFNKALSDDDVTTLEGKTTGFGLSKSSDIIDKNLYNFGGNIVGLYSFDSNALKDSSNSNADGKYIKQSSSTGFDKSSTPDTSEATAEYSSDGKSLSINNLGKKNRAVLLDAKPSGDYTVSFQVQVTNTNSTSGVGNIMYVGKNDTSAYYTWFRKSNNSRNQLNLNEKNGNSAKRFHDKVFNDSNWRTITFVVENGVLKFYLDGEVYSDTYTLQSNYGTDALSIILAGLWNTDYNRDDLFVKNVYVFDKALDADQVAAVAKAEEGQTEFAILPSALSGSGTCGGYHATMKDTDVDIAQISERLAQNPNDDERRGWYYVNSHSKWADIEDCLASGKQYIGIYDKDKDNGIDNVDDAGKDTATVPSGADNDLKTAINAGNTNTKKFNKAPDNERSIRFYVDSQNHLRCFAWSGSTSKDGDIRTFCSLVYEKGYNDDDNSEQITKYEELNNALNTFYQKIAEKSDLSNNAVVRFSTNSAIGDNETATNKNLQKLIMKDWTNWSDYYQKYKEDNSGSEPETTDYLQNLLIGNDKSSTDTTKSSHGIDEYPYVMTGGTYTWTGLKAFYDNMVNKDATDASQTTKDIANDARDKYLIIFTDGRDNTQDYSVSEATDDTPAGSPVYDGLTKDNSTFGKENYVNKYNPYAGEDHKVGFSFEYYDYKDDVNDALVPQFKKGVRDITKDGDLAQAWADKLKDEGYTIYCVMMASGSISPTANADEYNKAKNFLKSLSGSNELDAQIAQMQQDIENRISDGLKPDGAAEEQTAIEALRDEYVIVVDPTVTGGMTVTDAFEQILEDIQLPRNDYTVQDYIDPRFDLIGEAYVDGNEKPQEVIYHLGANGEVTFTDTNNNKLASITVDAPNGTKVTLTSGTTVGNIIDHINETGIVGLAYTPQESFMVNRKADSSSDDGYDTGNIGTGYIYYDDVKDMYYLRWTDQIIPMENEAFDTDKDYRNLDVWSATIRLKAKDDFIGGNNILTNGNEAGENLVYSDATIDNMTDNPELYGLAGSTYREKLAVLSGTDRKINAVDADGVSQAVYGNGIDIPSSGFPRTTVNVRLLKLDAKNLNDVIYMGEVVSPTMMLADLEDGYMTGSYYLQYLERYAYRLYGEDADKTPLIELLNKWLKIDDKNQEKKTFTIPYIYLPDPEYDENGKLARDTATNKVNIQNSTGASWDGNDIDFADLNLRDVTGFITYTWKREDVDINGDGNVDDDDRESQQVDSSTGKYDITKDYVAKNTKQIKYNLQLKFTPLKETAEELKDFKLDTNFINADTSTGKGGDKFFNIGTDGEFAEMTTDGAWTTAYGRADYLQAMIQEKRTYTPHVMYDATAGEGVNKGKWELVATGEEKTACETYADGDDQITDNGNKTVTDSGVYDWDSSYKKAPGNAQLEGGTSDDAVNNIKGFYTTTPNNVNLLDVDGNAITDKTGAVTGSTAPVSLVANTTYTKDVVNAALALELFVDGKYLKGTDNIITVGTEYKFIATRDYKDPYNKPSYATEAIGANADSKKYQLTFKVTEIPDDAKENEISRVWAKLEEVQVEKTDGTYESIKTADGYAAEDALPIGTYEIKTKPDSEAETELNSLKNDQFKIGTNATDEDVNFKYLKIENDKQSYAYDKFPESVYEESDTAAESTKDGEYLIWNEDTSKDNSNKNIADNKRVKDSTTDTQTVTFYFGTVAEKKDGTTTLKNTKGVSVKEYLKEHPEDTKLEKFTNDYAKDRLGIIMLSADNNSLAITKEVKNTKKDEDIGHSWKFTVTVKPESGDATTEFKDQNTTGFKLKWYKDDALKTVAEMNEMGAYTSTVTNYPETITFDGSGNIYTATIYLKHDEKVVIDGLPEGTWQVTEDLGGVFCTPHNDQSEFGEDEWQYNRADSTRADGIDLTPASQVNYINEFPYELPSTGGSGTVRYLLMGTALISVGAMLFAVLFFDRRKKARK